MRKRGKKREREIERLAVLTFACLRMTVKTYFRSQRTRSVVSYLRGNLAACECSGGKRYAVNAREISWMILRRYSVYTQVTVHGWNDSFPPSVRSSYSIRNTSLQPLLRLRFADSTVRPRVFNKSYEGRVVRS